VFVHAHSDEAPEWMQIETAANEFQALGHAVIPFLKVIGDADVYCFDTKGRIQRWSHEENSFEAYSGTFFDVLRYECLELEERRKRKMAEQGGATNQTKPGG
jgi:hypothetical protein